MNIKTILLSSFIALTSVTSANALDIPQGNKHDTRIRTVIYNEWDVVRVIGSTRTAVQLVFSEDEEVIEVAAGDNIAWEVAVRNNIIFLKARETNPTSNLQVVTQKSNGKKRSYIFELKTREGNVSNNTKDVYFAVRFQYPQDVKAQRRLAQEKQRENAKLAAAERSKKKINKQLHNAVGHGRKNYSYLAAGARNLEPYQVHDNGEVTVMKFRKNTRIGSFFFVDSFGNERAAPTSVKGNQVIVHGVRKEIRIRLGKAVLAVYNADLNNGIVNTGTSTSSHHITREIKGN